MELLTLGNKSHLLRSGFKRKVFLAMLCAFFVLSYVFMPAPVRADTEKRDGLKRPIPAKAEDISSDPLLSGGIKFYQSYYSSIFGGHCSLYPSCSNYSLCAFKKHGAFLGFLLTYDRLIHETDESKYSYKILIEKKRIRYYDPIINNVFWSKKRRDKPIKRLVIDVEKRLD